MIKLKSKVSYALYFLLALVFVGCTNESKPRRIEEFSVVEKVSKSYGRDDKRFWVLTSEYNFYTNKPYFIGDTVKLGN